ncbi:hypothetical protein BSL78_03646 [Apostichopus japonicus]|uniref:Fibronectin type-III domain-containing protein n=1 Tax=Stichopus japonicus TaxID=307972 RepID=A0A2G8LGQ7_STIJA|nr:hypothetical protein BSL78_03646 [Apostichopus japonicus]
MQNSFYGGRLSFVDEGDLRQGSPPPWANQRVFVFQMPSWFFKGGHYRSKFGHRGIGRIWIPEEAPCGGEISKHVFPSEITEQAFSLDSSLPCYQTPPSYDQSEPLEFSDVTSTGVTVTWPAWNETVDHGHGPIVEYRIQIKGPGEEEFTEIPKGRQLFHQFTGLRERVDYKFRISVFRDHPFGEGTPSNEQTCRTSGPPSFANPEPLEFRDVTSSSVRVSWPEWDPRVDSGTGPVTRYKIFYRQEGERRWTTEETSGLFVLLTELTDGTAYEVAISLEDMNGDNTNASVAQIVTTACEDLVITDLSYTSSSRRVGYARAVVMWSVEGDTDSCRVLSQNLSFRLLDVLECGGVPPTVDATPRVVDVKDVEARTRTVIHLTANSLYNLTLSLNTQTGTYQRSMSIQTVTTRPTGEPTNLLPEQKGNGDLVFHWNKPECSKRNGPINSYYYTVATFIPNAMNPPPVIAEHVEDNKIRLRIRDERLLQNQQYVFTVRATTGTGSNDLSSPTTDMQFVFES